MLTHRDKIVVSFRCCHIQYKKNINFLNMLMSHKILINKKNLNSKNHVENHIFFMLNGVF